MKQFRTVDGKNTVTRLSRWIRVKQKYNISKRNSLYEFSTDGTQLDYFHFNGRNYAIKQFITLGSVWCGGAPYEFKDTDKKSTFIHAVEFCVDFCGDLYEPLYIELDECGERVRVYKID